MHNIDDIVHRRRTHTTRAEGIDDCITTPTRSFAFEECWTRARLVRSSSSSPSLLPGSPAFLSLVEFHHYHRRAAATNTSSIGVISAKVNSSEDNHDELMYCGARHGSADRRVDFVFVPSEA